MDRTDTTHVSTADLVDDLIEAQEQDDYFVALEPTVEHEFASWGFGGTYSEM